MLRFVQRLNYRAAVHSRLDALLLMYPRTRQFERDFPALKAMIHADFESGVDAASSALKHAAEIIEGLLRQLKDEGKQAAAQSLAAADLAEIEALARRRVRGERDQRGEGSFFAVRLSAVALMMAARMAATGVIRHAEYEHLAEAISLALGADSEVVARRFAPALAAPDDRR